MVGKREILRQLGVLHPEARLFKGSLEALQGRPITISSAIFVEVCPTIGTTKYDPIVAATAWAQLQAAILLRDGNSGHGQSTEIEGEESGDGLGDDLEEDEEAEEAEEAEEDFD